MIGRKTIMPMVRRSRRSWISSFLATTRMRPGWIAAHDASSARTIDTNASSTVTRTARAWAAVPTVSSSSATGSTDAAVTMRRVWP